MALHNVGALLRVVLFGLSFCASIASVAQAQDLRGEIEGVVRNYIQNNPQAIQQIVKDYLANNPDLLQQILADTLKRQRETPDKLAAPAPLPVPSKSEIIRENAAEIFNSRHQATIGNSQGDVTLVEFFDYSCGFCKRALSDKIELLKNDSKLRIVLKDFPILGPNSLAAARVAIAARMQDASGDKMFEFHKRLLGEAMPPTRERALGAARDAGFDVSRIEADEKSKEVEDTLSENARLARVLGINGTPSYVIGENVVIGAVGELALKTRIESLRR